MNEAAELFNKNAFSDAFNSFKRLESDDVHSFTVILLIGELQTAGSITQSCYIRILHEWHRRSS